MPLQKKAKIKDLFEKSNTNLSAGLDPQQMKIFLDAYAEREVSDAAVKYVLLVVQGLCGANEISEDDIITAVSTWESLADDQEKIKAKFDEFDKDNTGTLSHDQVGQMLTWMNGGAKVSPEEIQWVIEQADSSGEGSLRKEEINAAVAVWYTKVTEEEPKKSKTCAIL